MFRRDTMAKARAKLAKAAKKAPARRAPRTAKQTGARLTALLARAESEGLPALDEALGAIARPVAASRFPELHARLAALDVAPALARSLRAGLVDELGWPALEEAAAELGDDELALHGGLPAVIVANATRAIAVGPRGRYGVHDLAIPCEHKLVSMRYVGGQFLVLLARRGRARAYWSGAPHEIFDVDAPARSVARLAPRACVLADGAWLEGQRPLRVGDRAWPDSSLAACDGEVAWVLASHGGRSLHREAPASGELGRFSWAAVLEAGLQPDWHLDGQTSYVLPAPEGLDASPLGANDGLLGLRVSYHGEPVGAREVLRIDGRTWSGPMQVQPRELLALPGGELRPLIVHRERSEGTTVTIVDEAGRVAGSTIGARERRYWRGSVAAYPIGLWHALQPRDPDGSQWLRAAGDADARALLRDALAARTLDQLADAVPVEIVERAIPDITHPRLRAGVAGMISLAAQLQLRRDALASARRSRRRPLS